MSTQLVDMHLHMWDLDRSAYAWLRVSQRSITRTGCRMRCPQLGRLRDTAAVLVQSDGTDSGTDAMLEVRPRV